MPCVNDPGDWSQVQEEMAIEQTEEAAKQYACRCPRCDRFGLVEGHDNHYGTIYRYECLPTIIYWAINPETGEKIEGG